MSVTVRDGRSMEEQGDRSAGLLLSPHSTAWVVA
jgi:hypothetical protein